MSVRLDECALQTPTASGNTGVRHIMHDPAAVLNILVHNLPSHVMCCVLDTMQRHMQGRLSTALGEVRGKHTAVLIRQKAYSSPNLSKLSFDDGNLCIIADS